MRGGFTVHRDVGPGIDAVFADSAYHFARHTHDQFGIGVIERGGQLSHSGRGQVEAGPGDVITVNPGEVHDGQPVGGSGRRWRMLYIAPELVDRAVADLTEGRLGTAEFTDPVVRHPAVARRLRRLLDGLTGSGAALGPTEADALVLELVASLTRLMISASSPSVPDAIRMAIARIDEDPSAPVSLTDLAKTAGLSRFQLLRGVRHATGLTPHAYILQARLTMARRLIVAGRSLADVAATCGFSDQSHLTRAFVRRFGFTPGALASTDRSTAVPHLQFRSRRRP